MNTRNVILLGLAAAGIYYVVKILPRKRRCKARSAITGGNYGMEKCGIGSDVGPDFK